VVHGFSAGRKAVKYGKPMLYGYKLIFAFVYSATRGELMVAHKELSKKDVKERQRKKLQDFSEEYMNKDVIIRLSTGEEVRGKLMDSTRYWFKILIRNPNAESELESIDVIYVNKAYVAYVKPLS
jgi:hypothetical protein